MEKIEMTMRWRHGMIYDVFLGEMHLFTSSKLVADPICDSFNEHDTLKAKAELLDEAIKAIDSTLGRIADSMPMDCYYKLDEILTKAKELDK